jgi:hypothetical protein
MAETPHENIASGLTAPERLMLFCIASRTPWTAAGVEPMTVPALLTNGLIEPEHSHTYRLTEKGRAALAALLAGQL